MTPRRPITEEDLHGYVDGALEVIRREEVETYLRLHQNIARRVQAYARQREALQAMLAPIADEPIPPELALARLVETRRRDKAERFMSWRAAAAGLLLFGLGGAGGWVMHGMAQPPMRGVAALAQEAVYNYTVYSHERTPPVDFDAGEKQKFIEWISRSVNVPVMVPDLSASGYHFMGGRLVATEYGPAGLLIYGNGHGVRLVMLLRHMEKDKNTGKVMVQSNDGPMTGFSWSRNGVGYSVVAADSAEILHPIANEIRRQINLNI